MTKITIDSGDYGSIKAAIASGVATPESMDAAEEYVALTFRLITIKKLPLLAGIQIAITSGPPKGRAAWTKTLASGQWVVLG